MFSHCVIGFESTQNGFVSSFHPILAQQGEIYPQLQQSLEL
jgi:hypothetical protein